MMKPKFLLKSTMTVATSLAIAATGTVAAQADSAGSGFAAPTSPGSARGALSPRAASTTTTQPVDITRVGGVAVIHRSKGLVAVRIAGTTADDVTGWYINAMDIYRGTSKRGSVSGTDIEFDQKTSSLVFHFPNSWGRGQMSVRNIQLAVTTSDGSSQSYTDSAAGTFDARSRIRGAFRNHAIIHFLRKGKRLHVSIAAQYYGTSGWTALKRKVVRIQERHNGWKTVKKVRTDRHGKASWTRFTRHRYVYRMTIGSTHTLQGGVSKPTSSRI